MYEYNPDAWNPILAGVVAGAIGAIAASLLSLPLTSPNDTIGNALTITVVALVIGVFSGLLWRRLRAGRSAQRDYWIAIGLGAVAALTALAITDFFVLEDTFQYAVPVAVVIFLTVGLLTPPLAAVVIPRWVAALPLLIAIGIALGVFAAG